MKRLDLTGKKFGRLTVLNFAGVDTKGNTTWLCKCDCGEERIIRGTEVKRKTRSCGCLHKESLLEAVTTHGKKKTKAYNTWRSMKKRCYLPKNSEYKYYGARGIKVCDRWLKFENFYQDMGEPPDDLSLDRIDNDGDYCPENCRWATLKQQARNNRNNKLLTYKGKTQCIAAWAEELNIPYSRIWSRVNRGWSVKEALTLPFSQFNKRSN